MAKIKATSKSVQVHFQGEQSAVVPKFSPLESLRFVKDSSGVVTFVSDTYLLLNAERLRTVLGEDTYSAILRMCGQSSSAKTPYVLDLSDEDMLSTLKSRYIQSPSECRAYAQDILNRGSGLSSAFKEYLSSLTSTSSEEKTSSSESSSSSEPSNS